MFTFTPYDGIGYDYESLAFACDAESDLALLSGSTAQDAYQRTIAAFDNAIAILKTQRKFLEAAILSGNRNVFRIHGNPHAKL